MPLMINHNIIFVSQRRIKSALQSRVTSALQSHVMNALQKRIKNALQVASGKVSGLSQDVRDSVQKQENYVPPCLIDCMAKLGEICKSFNYQGTLKIKLTYTF